MSEILIEKLEQALSTRISRRTALRTLPPFVSLLLAACKQAVRQDPPEPTQTIQPYAFRAGLSDNQGGIGVYLHRGEHDAQDGLYKLDLNANALKPTSTFTHEFEHKSSGRSILYIFTVLTTYKNDQNMDLLLASSSLGREKGQPFLDTRELPGLQVDFNERYSLTLGWKNLIITEFNWVTIPGFRPTPYPPTPRGSNF